MGIKEDIRLSLNNEDADAKENEFGIGGCEPSRQPSRNRLLVALSRHDTRLSRRPLVGVYRGRVGELHSPAPLCHAIHREGFGVDTKYY